MPFMEYYVENISVTGTRKPYSPTVLSFSGLTDVRGRQLPSSFSPAPLVDVFPSSTNSKVRVAAISTTSVSLVNDGLASSVTVNLKISGDV